MVRRISYQRGTVEQKNGKWTLRYRVRDPQSKTGWKLQRQMLEGCRGEKEARKQADEIMVTINAKTSGVEVQSVPTFAEFAEGLWQTYLSRKQPKPSTIYSYDSMLRNYILPALGKKTLKQISPADLTHLFNKLQKDRASKYLLNLYALLNTMLEVALSYDFIRVSPLKRKLHRPQNSRKNKVALSAEQIRQVLGNVPEEHKALFVCAALTGVRLGELLGLRWCDVEFSSCKLTINHNLWRGQLGSPKTEGSAASMHMPTVLLDALLNHRQRSSWSDGDDFVFCKLDGSSCDPDYLRKEVLYPALQEAGIERVDRTHGFHLFRHSAGSIIHAQTGDMKLAQEQLRHTQISTTSDIYVHVDETVSKKAAEALAQAIMPTCAPVVPQASEMIQ
jgi:integrase